jgi:hypothetical protein
MRPLEPDGHDFVGSRVNTEEPMIALLAERRKTHGDFADHAFYAQEIKRIIARQYDKLSDEQREALSMIAHKIGRILAGDPNHRDHWDDIAGYARLVVRTLP